MKNDIVLYIKDRLSHIINIDYNYINKIYEELICIFSETPDEYIQRRHIELKKNGYKNKEIYTLINKEIRNYLFKCEVMSERQIKRIIYKE